MRRRRGYEVVVVGTGSNGPATLFQARIIRDHVASQWRIERGWDVVVRRAAIKDAAKPRTRARGKRT